MHDIRKELRLRDVVLAQILVVLGLSGPGMAARAGAGGLVFWLSGILLFYIPLAVVVVRFSRILPLEGGVYQWVKYGSNEFLGFLVGWNTWLFGVVNMSAIGISAATAVSYAFGPTLSWVSGNAGFIGISSCVLIAAITAVAALGLRIGKWVHNTGSVVLLVVFGLLLVLPLERGDLSHLVRLQLRTPAPSVTNVAILVRMSAYALGGLEYLAIFAGECRDATRTISRSVFIAAPMVAVVNVLATNSILNFVRPGQVDLINPIAQVFSIAFRNSGGVSFIVSGAILLLLARDIAQTTCIFTGSTRLPMVAGWDHLLPGWFTRLHPRFGTPVNSIMFVGAVSVVAALLSIVGVAQQEAYQLLLNASAVFVVFGYLPLFFIAASGRIGLPLWARITSVSGFTMTTLFLLLFVFPIVEVGSKLSYSIKIGSVIAAADLVAAALYWKARRNALKLL